MTPPPTVVHRDARKMSIFFVHLGYRPTACRRTHSSIFFALAGVARYSLNGNGLTCSTTARHSGSPQHSRSRSKGSSQVSGPSHKP